MPTKMTHEFAARGVLRLVWAHRDGEVLVSGPAGTGKSRSLLEKLHMTMLMNPGARGLMIRKTATSLGSSALVTWKQYVVPEALEDGTLYFFGGGAQEPPQYKYSNGSVIILGGMDKATRIMSTEYDMIYVQEATELTVTDWESLTTRLRNYRVSFQQIIGDCNPDVPTHWLKERCDRGVTLMLESKHEDNPTLFDEEGYLLPRGEDYIGKLDNLTGVRKERLRYGRWVAAEGMVYEDWMPSVHIIDRFQIPHNWRRFWSVDFGYTHPFVLQCWAEDPDGNLFMYREIYRTKRTVDQHAFDILEQVTVPNPNFVPDPSGAPAPACVRRGEWLEPRPELVICDWDAEGRQVLQRELGLPTYAAHKKVKEGIQAFQQRLRIDKNGRTRVFFLRDSVVFTDPDLIDSKRPASTTEEIPGYVWQMAQDGTLREEPVKEYDDGCDAARYIIAHRDLRSRPRIRAVQ